MRRIVIARGISNFCDEIWSVSLPLAFAASGLLIADLGRAQSAFATGDLLGFSLLPFFSIKFGSRTLSIWSDFIAAVASIVLGIILYLYGMNPIALIVLNFVLGLAFAIWFSNFDATMATALKKDQVVTYHRLLQISLNGSLLIAPIVAVFFNLHIGLAGIAILNGLSFLLQIGIFSDYTKHTNQEKRHKNLRDFYQEGIHRFRISPMLKQQTLVSLCFKFYYAIIPFMIYHMSKHRNFPESAGLSAGTLLTATGLGMVVSALLNKNKPPQAAGSEFTKYSFCMAAFGLVVMSLAFNPVLHFYYFLALMFVWGFFVARYQIYFRSLRQIMEPSTSFASIVAIQGLSVRIFGPAVGFLFPFFYNRDHRQMYFVAVGLVLTALVILALISLKRSLKVAAPI